MGPPIVIGIGTCPYISNKLKVGCDFGVCPTGSWLRGPGANRSDNGREPILYFMSIVGRY